jgi:3-hydroxybutyryl-CoA dehydrogenase
MNERLGIAGSGAIATGLARTAAGHGDVVLWARSHQSAERAVAACEGKVRVVTRLDELGDRTMVVEAIVEELPPKRQLLADLGRLLGERGVIASTTSSLSVAALAEATGRVEDFGILHVFNPVEKMKLVELAFPDGASYDTRARLRAVCETLGKTVVEVPDVPGFVVNRLLFPFLFNAVHMLDLGLDPRAVDTCMKLGAGHPMGPLQLLDFVGLDVAAAIGEEIGAQVPRRVLELVDRGHLGRKTGRGFYEY